MKLKPSNKYKDRQWRQWGWLRLCLVRGHDKDLVEGQIKGMRLSPGEKYTPKMSSPLVPEKLSYRAIPFRLCFFSVSRHRQKLPVGRTHQDGRPLPLLALGATPPWAAAREGTPLASLGQPRPLLTCSISQMIGRRKGKECDKWVPY